ncbi:transposase [Micromonospora chersina]|uniref:IS110 family transposase n=1 Tax=Micromonospora chersina TaxID=47854 RepID=UPI003790FDC6
MPVEFVTDELAEAYGKFTEEPTRPELERFFFLDDVDRDLIALRLTKYQLLGFALQMSVPGMPEPTVLSHDHHAVDEVILGVDTHKNVDVAAVVTALGAVVGSRSFSTTVVGYDQLLAWAQTFGALRRAGVDCTGSYGVALTRYLRGAGVELIEVNQPDRGHRRRRGKTDAMDAGSVPT